MKTLFISRISHCSSQIRWQHSSFINNVQFYNENSIERTGCLIPNTKIKI